VIITTKGGSIGGTYIKDYHWARHLREHTAKDYFNRFTAFLSADLLIEDIAHNQIEAFFFRLLF